MPLSMEIIDISSDEEDATGPEKATDSSHRQGSCPSEAQGSGVEDSEVADLEATDLGATDLESTDLENTDLDTADKGGMSSDLESTTTQNRSDDDDTIEVAIDASTDDEDIGDQLSSPTKSQTKTLKHTIPQTRTEFIDLLDQHETQAGLELLYPPSLWNHDANDTSDQDLQIIRQAFLSQLSEDDWAELELDEFCVYHGMDHKRWPGQYESLHNVASEQGKRPYLFDGCIDYNGRKIMLQGEEIVTVSIGGLEVGCHSCGDEFWIQTTMSSECEGWFRLRTPAKAYQDTWSDFLWIANFAKYCIDYFSQKANTAHAVSLEDFRNDFLQCLTQLHGDDPGFKRWKGVHGNNPDMRRHIAQFGSFIFDQCYSTESLEGVRSHPLWTEIALFVQSVNLGEERTLVTHNVEQMFLQSFPRWGTDDLDLLQSAECSAEVAKHRRERMQKLKLVDKVNNARRNGTLLKDRTEVSLIDVNLQVASQRNRPVTGPPAQLLHKLVVVRQCEGSKYYFDYAFVTQVTTNGRFARIVWMTKPADTVCSRQTTDRNTFKSSAFYPIGNELFFSDDCNCYSVKTADIVDVCEIDILEHAETNQFKFFASTLYVEGTKCFVRLQDTSQLDFTCAELCQRPSSKPSDPGKLGAERRRHNSGRWRERTESLPTLEHNPNRVPLSNLSLFSGCGLFDRALESSGCLHTTLSIDCDPVAICSARANGNSHSTLGSGEFVVNSVNAELHNIMTSKRSYPEPGSMSAGCPCPGFSTVNVHKESRKSQRDCSLLASTISWIEVTLPGYIVIENVPGMDSGSPSACCQAIAHLVMLGYQVRKFILKASDFGGCTSRERLFIVAAAPVFSLPDCPTATHGVGEGLIDYFTVKKASSDLAPIHNDTLINPKEPYHVPFYRCSANITTNGVNFRDVMHRIPTSPAGQGLISSKDMMTSAQQKWISSLHPAKQEPTSQTMRRVDANGFFRTVVTTGSWQCARTGQLLHYDQDRVLSVEELLRAQGVPKNMVLVGSTKQRVRQVGNAVTWCLREAISKEIAKSYFQSPSVDYDEHKDKESEDRDGEDMLTVPASDDFDQPPRRREGEKNLDEQRPLVLRPSRSPPTTKRQRTPGASDDQPTTSVVQKRRRQTSVDETDFE